MLRHGFLSRFCPPKAGHGRCAYWLLAALIAGLAIWLLTAEPPWNARLQKSIAHREEAGKSWKVEHYVAVFVWVALLIDLILAIGLWASLSWWARPLTARRGRSSRATVLDGDRGPAAAGLGARRWMWIGLVAALVFGAVDRVPRLSHSWWSDEEYSFRTHIFGRMVESEDGSLVHQPVPWRDTVFRNKANNHYAFTIPARILHEWLPRRRNGGKPFSEEAVRLIPFLLGLASIVLIGLLTARYTGPMWGVGAAFFLALNPWHLRYSVEARGYSGMIFFLLLGFLALGPALRSGAWRYWLLFAFAQLLALFSYPGVLYVVAVQYGIVFGLILSGRLGHGRPSSEIRRLEAARPLVAGILTAMIFIPITLPAAAEIRAYVSSGGFVGHMNIDWFRVTWINLTTGLPVEPLEPDSHLGTSFREQSSAHFGFAALMLVVLPGLVVAGVAGAVLSQRMLLIPVVSIFGGATIAFFQNRAADIMLHPWYIIYLLVGVTLALCFGLYSLTSLVVRAVRLGRDKRVAASLHASVLVLFLLWYGLATRVPRAQLREHDRHPIRAAVAMARGEKAFDPDDGGLLTGSFGASRGMLVSYDPRDRSLKTPADLRALMQRADSSGKRLVIYDCGRASARAQDPQISAIIRDPKQFRELPEMVKGLEELFSFHLYEYLGSAAARAD